MTIHVRAWPGSLPNEPVKDDPTLQFTISGKQDIKHFAYLLNRALNVAEPQNSTNRPWFDLCDRVD